MSASKDKRRPQRWRIGVDIGGTFTDIVLVDNDGGIVLWKEDTDPNQPELAIEAGLRNVAKMLGLSSESVLSDASLFVHGSTVATNMIIQRRGPRVGLVCTQGFRDVLYFRDGFKWDRFNPRLQRPADFVPRYLRQVVRERVNANGEILYPLDDRTVRDVAVSFREHGVEAVAVALIWSFANPVHEQRVREIMRQELPSVPILLSSEILPELGEWVRTSATVLSAFVYEASRAYLARLEQWLKASQFHNDLLVMQLNGGCATVDQTLRVPINTIGSGPAAAPAAGLQVGRRVSARNMITVDMGGTSFDVCLIQDGLIPRSKNIAVEHQPIGVTGVEVHSIGAGGGSIAWIDSGGALRVGPQSAGARPGPAAYGQGGTEPTVTDANIVLGYLSPTMFLGGRRLLDRGLSETAILNRIAKPLGLTMVEAAAGIVRLVNENMVNAIGVVSVERGIDPRPFVLVAGGGAGALHAGQLAAQMEMARVLIPAEAGTISAYGMTVCDIRHDYSAALHTISTSPSVTEVRVLYDKLEQHAVDELVRIGFGRERVRLERTVDARYLGQVHELLVPVPNGSVDEDFFANTATAFHRLHDARYGWSALDRSVEFLHWRLTGLGLIDAPDEARFDQLDRISVQPTGHREAYFRELGGFVSTPWFVSQGFAAGGHVVGPGLIDAETTTIVVFPGQHLVGDGRGSYLLETGIGAAQSSRTSVSDDDRLHAVGGRARH